MNVTWNEPRLRFKHGRIERCYYIPSVSSEANRSRWIGNELGTCDCQRFYSMARKIISIAMHGEVVIIIDNNKQEWETATHNHNVYISRWGKIIKNNKWKMGFTNIEQQLESRRGGVILTKQSIPYGCRTGRSLNLEHATINCRFGWHIEMLIRDTNETITNDLLSRVEVRTGTKQINHEVSIRKNNGVWTTELRVDKTDTT